MVRVERSQQAFKMGTTLFGVGTFVAAIATPKIRRVGKVMSAGGMLTAAGGLASYGVPPEVKSVTPNRFDSRVRRLPSLAVALGGVMEEGWRWNRVAAVEVAGQHPVAAFNVAAFQEILADVRVWNVVPVTSFDQRLAARIGCTAFSAALVCKLTDEATDPTKGVMERQFAGYRLGRALNALVATLRWDDYRMIQEAEGWWVYNIWAAQQIMGDTYVQLREAVGKQLSANPTAMSLVKAKERGTDDTAYRGSSCAAGLV